MRETECDQAPEGAARDPWLDEFAHDLRQPLSTIQSSVCYLRLVLRGNERAMAQLDLIEQQVGEAENLLVSAVRTARRPFDRPAAAAAGPSGFKFEPVAAVVR
jgi:hypothetical protein